MAQPALKPLGQAPERALLVGVSLQGTDPEEAGRSLEELQALAESAGAEVVGRETQSRRGPDPATYVGSGKVEALAELAKARGAGLVVFDDELKPSQQRNLEEALGCTVLDRTQLILDVFAARAATKEGKLQVELAQLSYLLPRLVGMGKALSRLGGGIGTRGPGESKLEADRRRLRDRIAALSQEIEGVAKTRRLQREGRRRGEARTFALAGYTNAGKSTLFNALTEADVYVADRLFATLDPTLRPLKLEGGFPLPLLLVDTVGFIRKLPHALVAAFRATLEEVALADVVIRVVDASSEQAPAHLRAVDAVLQEIFEMQGLKAAEAPEAWLAFNKADLIPGPRLRELKAAHPQALFLSAATGKGLPALAAKIRAWAEGGLRSERFLLPAEAAGLLAKHFSRLKVLSQQWGAKGLELEAVMSQAVPEMEPYRVKKGKR